MFGNNINRSCRGDNVHKCRICRVADAIVIACKPTELGAEILGRMSSKQWNDKYKVLQRYRASPLGYLCVQRTYGRARVVLR